MSNIINEDRELLEYGWFPVERINEETGKREVAYNVDEKGRKYRLVKNAQGVVRNSVLPEDAWKALEAAVLQEASAPTSAVEDLRSRGLVRPAEMWETQYDFDVISEVTAANVTIDGEGADDEDQWQTERKSITVPVVSKSFKIGTRALGAYNSVPGRNYNTDLARAAAQVVREKFEYALFNGFGNVKLNTASQTYGYVNLPDTNTGASAGDWGTIGNAEATVKNMIVAESADNFFGPFMLYVSQVQYDEISTLYKSADNNVTELDRIKALPQIEDVKPVSATFLADGYAVLVALQDNAVAWVEAMPMRIIEWQSPSGMTTNFRVLAIAAPRTASTFANRCGICLSTGN